MISGTSNIWSTSGPVDLLIITKMAQTIQDKYGIILKPYYFHIWESDISDFFEIFERHIHQLFRTYFVLCLKYVRGYIFLKLNLWRWGLNMIFFHKDICKSLYMNFISIEKHETKCWSLFYFQVREPTNFFIFK